jgi:hypothetical protein
VIGCTAPRSLFHCRAASDLTLEMARRAPALVVPMSGLGCAFCSDDAPTRRRVALIETSYRCRYEGVRVTPPSRPWLERGPSNLPPEGDPSAARCCSFGRLIRTTTQPAPSRFDDIERACSLTAGSRFSQGDCLRGCAGPLSLGLTPA